MGFSQTWKFENLIKEILHNNVLKKIDKLKLTTASGYKSHQNVKYFKK